MLIVDGRQGEGGGQVLRTCLSLSALTQRPFRLTHIRANRSKPGLRPQHLTAVRAVAALCSAELSGDTLNSHTLEFRPQTPPQGGEYRFDVADAAEGGSAGSVTLIWQAILWPLLFADGPAQITLRGGTHVPFSPPYHYLAEVLHPLLARMGAGVSTDLLTWGWYPAGGGEMTGTMDPVVGLTAVSLTPPETDTAHGVAAVTNLPAHIPQRMARRAHNLLADAGFRPQITPLRERGPGPGAGIVLWLPQGGFSALGRKGLPAEEVAETAVVALQDFVRGGTAVDPHLADQLLIPAALAHGTTTYTTHRLTRHTLTNARLLQTWLHVPIDIDGREDHSAKIIVRGIGFSRNAG